MRAVTEVHSVALCSCSWSGRPSPPRSTLVHPSRLLQIPHSRLKRFQPAAQRHCRGSTVQVQALLFDPPAFDPQKLSVTLLPGGAHTGPHPPAARRYTLTHNDVTGALQLSIGKSYNAAQLGGWYVKLIRDEVLAEWQYCSSGFPSLHIHCHVSGEARWIATPGLRNYIFQREMPLVLDTIRHADSDLLRAFPQLADAPVFVHMSSHVTELDVTLEWGRLCQPQAWRRPPQSFLQLFLEAIAAAAPLPDTPSAPFLSPTLDTACASPPLVPVSTPSLSTDVGACLVREAATGARATAATSTHPGSVPGSPTFEGVSAVAHREAGAGPAGDQGSLGGLLQPSSTPLGFAPAATRDAGAGPGCDLTTPVEPSRSPSTPVGFSPVATRDMGAGPVCDAGMGLPTAVLGPDPGAGPASDATPVVVVLQSGDTSVGRAPEAVSGEPLLLREDAPRAETPGAWTVEEEFAATAASLGVMPARRGPLSDGSTESNAASASASGHRTGPSGSAKTRRVTDGVRDARRPVLAKPLTLRLSDGENSCLAGTSAWEIGAREPPGRGGSVAEVAGAMLGGEGRAAAVLLEHVDGEGPMVQSARFVGKWLAEGHEVVLVPRPPAHKWGQAAVAAERASW